MITDTDRLKWLHTGSGTDPDGYEWGVFRVKWENGRPASVLHTASDFSDLDREIEREVVARLVDEGQFKAGPSSPQPVTTFGTTTEEAARASHEQAREHYRELSVLPCPQCGGEGIIDSGGVTPEGAAIDLPCPACRPEHSHERP